MTIGNSPTRFGFNYWPSGYMSDSLFTKNWPTQKKIIEQDIVQMKSLGTEVVRINFFPGNATGWWVSMNNQGSSFAPEYSQMITNLPELIKMFSDYQIKVVISFYNFEVADHEFNGTLYWMAGYGNTQDGWIRFMTDSNTWINGVVNAIEQSSYKDTVVYYDMECEWWRNPKNNYGSGQNYGEWCLNFIYDHSMIPAKKHGISTLATNEFVGNVKTALGSRVLDFYDIHSYPEDATVSENVEGLYSKVKSVFPNTKIVMGEFGRRNVPGGEAAQVDTVLSIRNRAVTKDYLFTLNWMLWDDPVSTAGGFGYGFGASPHVVRDLMGAMPNSIGLLENHDFEENNCVGEPNGWTFAGLNANSISLQHNTAGVDSGRCNGRLIVKSKNAGNPSWICSSTKIGSLESKRKLYVNFYFQTSMKDVRLGIHEYTSLGTEIKGTVSPAYNAVGWSWNNYINRVGAWHLDLQPDTDFAAICIMAVSSANTTDYLDVDAVSVWAE